MKEEDEKNISKRVFSSPLYQPFSFQKSAQ